jgi:hypothetical protein
MSEAAAMSGPALCGAKTRKGTPCPHRAGAGTPHLGSGRCKWHGGATPSHDAVGEFANRDARRRQGAQLRQLAVHVQDAAGVLGPAGADQGDEARGVGVAARTDHESSLQNSWMRPQASVRLAVSVA